MHSPSDAATTAGLVWSGTPFSPRTADLNRNALWMHWDGKMVVDVYDDARAELRAIREGVAMGDMSPLSKYEIRGRDAEPMLDHLITRDVTRQKPGQVYYTPWCDERGKVVNDGLVIRLDATRFWISADPNRAWLERHCQGFDVELEDITDRMAILTLQGPSSPAVLEAASGVDWGWLPFSRIETARLADRQVRLLRQGFTGEVGYELWCEADDAVAVWDAVAEAGAPFGIRAAGAYTLDVARVEAGLLIIGYDYAGAGADRHGASVDVDPGNEGSPFELGLGRLVNLRKRDFVGRAALAAEAESGAGRRLTGIDCDWRALLAVHETRGVAPTGLGRVQWYSKPVTAGDEVVGRTSSLTWSPSVGSMIGFAHVEAGFEADGRQVSVGWEIAGDQVAVPATIRDLPLLSHNRAASLA